MAKKTNLRHTLGHVGEDLAAAYLTERGYTILERNFRNRLGEIDVIAQINGTICFIEVKTRKSVRSGTPFEAISRAKQVKLVRVALSYLKSKGRVDSPARFDIIGIDSAFQGLESVELLENAIDLSDMKYR